MRIGLGCILLLSMPVTMMGRLCTVAAEIVVVDRPSVGAEPPHYVGNRAPLLPSPLVRLPIGAIEPRGWLRGQLELGAAGMVGRLNEISPWCRFEGNSWSDPAGAGHSGWEELPYWLKGFGDLGYVLGDQAIIDEARRWIEATLRSQDSSGWFGPRGLQTSLDGKADLWPQMVMLNCLQSYYEYSGDPRVLELMARYFRWQTSVPDADFLVGYWPHIRGGDNQESVYWLYNRTGDASLLQLAEKIHRRTIDWTSGKAPGLPDWHGVNVTQGFREPAIYYLLAKDPKYLHAAERNYQTVMGLYGQFPGGGFGADEVCRPGYTDPRQGFETCSMVEFMHSFEMLARISGDPVWADRCEEIAFNSLPAALTADGKALHYLTGANMPQLDKENKAPGIMNSGTMLSFSPFAVYRCCQHNVSHGWPYYAEECWLATSDRGLCAMLYADTRVKAHVGSGAGHPVAVTVETNYPFDETVTFRLELSEPTAFPLYLRIPRWCSQPVVAVVGEAATVRGRPGAYFKLERTWKPGDQVRLSLPMQLGVRSWPKNQQSVSVDYGPLTFSLKIDEAYQRYGGTDAWPEWEVRPVSTWNYALVVDPQQPEQSLEVVRGGGPPAKQPFTLEDVSIRLKAKARRLPEWQLDARGLVNVLQASPAYTDEPEVPIELVPMGAARLRITSFPVASTSPTAHHWQIPNPPRASHVHSGDSVEALNDGVMPSASNDQSIPRFTWWDHRGTTEWVEYQYLPARRISKAAVYWFDDTGHGQCRVPKSWRLLVKEGEAWRELATGSPPGIGLDQMNRVEFPATTTTAIRLEAELQDGFSAGILEWRVE